MDIRRLENLHRTDQILDLINKHEQPLESIKFNRKILKIKIPCLESEPLYDDTDIEIENIDTITATIREITNGHKTLLLNMANAHRPGGGFYTGAKAQEEDLCRCTNLIAALNDKLYPMMGTEIIYSPKIHILRDAKYHNLKQPLETAVCSIAAHNTPRTNMYGMLPRHIYDETEIKIRMMFHLALLQKYDCLVLGALGCGAFHNPPHEIAQMFCQICTEYAQQFKKIVFAVKSTDNDNCEVFQKAFLNAFA